MRLFFNKKNNEYVCVTANAGLDGVQSTTWVGLGLGLDIGVTICQIVFNKKVDEYAWLTANGWPDGVQSTTLLGLGLG